MMIEQTLALITDVGCCSCLERTLFGRKEGSTTAPLKSLLFPQNECREQGYFPEYKTMTTFGPSD